MRDKIRFDSRRVPRLSAILKSASLVGMRLWVAALLTIFLSASVSARSTLPCAHRLELTESIRPVGGPTESSIKYGTKASPKYDKVGNRIERNSSGQVAGLVPSATYTVNCRDQLNADVYDRNGITITTQGNQYWYDSEDRLIERQDSEGEGSITITYDADGNRVNKGDGMIVYLVDDQNPTGYPQVLLEYSDSEPGTAYTYGLDLVRQTVYVDPPAEYDPPYPTNPRYFGYDGLGSVRYLTDENANITDAYNYDAFGILIEQFVRDGGVLQPVTWLNQEFVSPNNYLFTGEQWDPELGMYYLRARYYQPQTGRFWTMDSYEGSSQDPLSLHKYLYCSGNPVNRIDPSGNFGDFISLMVGSTIANSLNATYNGMVSAAGSAMQATLFGVQAGQSMNEILTGFVLDETGIGLAVDAYQAMQGYFQTEEETAMAAYMLWRENLIATILASMEDNEFGEIRVELVPQCFLAGTPVATGDGLKPIEEIRPGDNVWAWNEATDELALRSVLNRFVHQRKEIFEISVGCDTFKVTGEHAFYVSGKGWVPSREVAVGDQFVTSDDRAVLVDSVAQRSGDFLVYNFEVGTDHNYYVGEEGVLTHNLNALRAAMKLKNPLLAAHHIVALRAKGARVCRDLLLAPGTGIIKLNDIRNGVPLPKNLKVRVPGYAKATVHSVVHTKRYWDELASRLASVAPGQRIQVLSQTANELLLGKFPYK